MPVIFYYLIGFLSVLTVFTFGQNTPLPLNNDIQYQIECNQSLDENFNSSIKPYYKNNISVNQLLGADKQNFLKKLSERYIGHIHLYPIAGFTNVLSPPIKQSYSQYFYGFGLDANLTNKWALGVNFFSGEFQYVPWIDSVIKYRHVVPGINKAEATQFGYASKYLTYYLNYRPSKFFLLEVGRGKNFIGDGYRSLLLSDNAAPYPYFKILTSAWKFNYFSLWNIMQHYNYFGNTSNYSLMALHYLSFKANKHFTLAFFESEVYANRDTSGKTIKPEISYFNPVIFYRPVEYSLGSADNALMGFNVKCQLNSNHQLYTQIAIDEFNFKLLRTDKGWWGNKQAFQIGYKWYNIFKVKGLGIQTEYNFIRPYVYSHGLVQQNYSHLNQPLAHPLGANLTEGIAILRYQYKRWMYENIINYIIYGQDTNGVNFGGDIFKSYYFNRPNDFGNYTSQGLQSERTNITFRTSYYIWPKAYLSIDAGITWRINQTSFKRYEFRGFYLGIRSRIFNSYSDF